MLNGFKLLSYPKYPRQPLINNCEGSDLFSGNGYFAAVAATCTVVGATAKRPLLVCDTVSRDRDEAGRSFILTVPEELGGPTLESWEQVVTRGAHKYAGLMGVAVVDTVHTDPAR